MKVNKSLIAIVLIFISAITALSLDRISKNTSAIQSIPATVCPGDVGDGSVVDQLPNSKTLIAPIPSNLSKMKSAETTNLLTKKALLVDGGSVTTVSIQKGSNGSLAVVNCSISDGNDWFVGGSSSVTSKGSIFLINSGLSAAQVDLIVYSQKAPTTISKTVPANSQMAIPIDTLAPGDDSIAVNVITRSGRVSTFMFDERRTGLKALGSEYVSTSTSPGTTIVIPSIPKINAKSSGRQLIRIVVPGSVSANLKAEVYSADGAFAPMGLDGISVPGSTVRDLEISPVVSDSSYSLRLDADVPIVASVLTQYGSDFLWSTAAPKLAQTYFQLGGMTPLVRLYGSVINTSLELIDVNGKKSTVKLSGTDTISFRPRQPLVRIGFIPKVQNQYGGLILNSGSGFSSIPIEPGSHLESSQIPKSDARTINRE